jgi:putative DNA methylase
MDAKVAKPKVVPFSLKDAPSLIEHVWPAQKISVEAQKERKAVKGQTLTGLGSFWKGRKPLFLVRACILGALLPSTGDDEKDLEIFDILCGMDADQISDRFKVPLSLAEITTFATASQSEALLDRAENGELTLKKLHKEIRPGLMSSIIARMPYQKRVEKLLRPEEVPEKTLTQARMQEVNDHLGTNAVSLTDLIEQLGVMRFGKRPCVGDTFCGGGSIPFEAARVGCDVYASDLNPIACMLTWGALKIIGASPARRAEIAKAQAQTIAAVDQEITELGIEHDEHGNRAKAYLYCVETRCPQTQWMVPLSPSWVISKSRKVVAVLVPDKVNKRYKIEVRADVSDSVMAEAARGTVQSGRLVHVVDGETYSTPIKTIRGDRKGPNGESVNNLRQWEKSEFEPRADDIFQERLYCIQWFTKESLDKPRKKTFFAGVTPQDVAREEIVRSWVRKNLPAWQEEGLVPDMVIEPGEKTDEPIRTRGWTYWHHLFTPRDYIVVSSVIRNCSDAAVATAIPSLLNHVSKLCQWATTTAPLDAEGNQAGGARDLPNHVFYNQAFNTFWNYASRGSMFLLRDLAITDEVPSYPISSSATVVSRSAKQLDSASEIFITDPPYADAVHYHEISEFFIPWLRKNPPTPFAKWTWDSRRALAIKGDGEEFRHNMVEAYRTMAEHMPDNGLQIVMFTHQSSAVWADMAQIFWGAGLQVMAAWYIATETTSELKKGGYVQGTVILVARKRRASESGYKDEIVQEVRSEVADQIDTMAGLNQHLKGHGRIENLFEDADLQMAGYAAALRVLTKYAKIDGTDMTKEALRPRRAGEKNLVGEIIDFAVQVANEHMVPEHMTPKLWEGLFGAERFYFKMLDIETTSLRKLDNYQNFAKAFRVSDYGTLMGSMEPNKARLKTAKEFKKAGFETPEFGSSATRAALFAIFELENEVEGDDVLSHLKDMLPNYHTKRDDLAAIADYIARKREVVDETESRAARILHDLIRNERLG